MTPLSQKEISRRWYLKNKELTKERAKVWYKNNSEKAKKTRKDWATNNRESLRESDRKRREAERVQTPSWLSSEQRLALKSFYDNRPEGFHVDHIIPLQGKGVCGLHVPWNLQYLKPKDNFIKGVNYDQ